MLGAIDKEAIYRRSPLFLQEIAINFEGIRIQRSRHGSAFWAELVSAESRSSLSHEQVCAFRDQRLRAFIKHAVDTTPYYRDLFGRLGLAPEDIRTLDDLQALPVLTKAQVQDNPAMFVSAAIPERRRVGVHTSGTTGAGLQFTTTLPAQQEQWAVWWRYWRWHGLQLGTWCGYFGGRSIVPIRQKRPPFWRINYAGRQILFSAYHTGPNNLQYYVEELRRRRPPWLHGYPSHLALIASHLVETGFDLGYRPQWITIGAENLLPHQISIIEAAFGTTPLQHYGMAEGIANVSQCEAGALHVDEDFAAVEFLPLKTGEGYRIVGTNFSNLAMPLIRYDVGDHAELSVHRCRCGRPGRIVAALDGRQEDYVLTRDGTPVGRLDHIFKDLASIREAQIRQSRPGEINVSVVKSPTYTARDEAELRREFASRLGTDMTLEISYVEQLERTKQGKLRFVISELPESRIVGGRD